MNTNDAPYSTGMPVWTGSEMILAGTVGPTDSPTFGVRAYDPINDVWRPISNVGFLSIYFGFWTGEKAMYPGNGVSNYDPRTDTWDTVASPFNIGGAAVWTGNSLLVYRSEDGLIYRYAPTKPLFFYQKP